MDMAGGTVIAPPTPPVTDTHDGARRNEQGGRYYENKEKEEQERIRINQILQEDEIILMALKTWLNNFN
jgi:hypothetical protein